MFQHAVRKKRCWKGQYICRYLFYNTRDGVVDDRRRERECLLVISRTEERVKAARAEKQSVNIFAGTPNTENILI